MGFTNKDFARCFFSHRFVVVSSLFDSSAILAVATEKNQYLPDPPLNYHGLTQNMTWKVHRQPVMLVGQTTNSKTENRLF